MSRRNFGSSRILYYALAIHHGVYIGFRIAYSCSIYIYLGVENLDFGKLKAIFDLDSALTYAYYSNTKLSM